VTILRPVIRRLSALVSVAIVLGYFVVGLYPFDFFAANRARRMPDGQGISFRRPAVAYGEGVCEANGELVVELELQPAGLMRTNWFLELYDGTLPGNLQLGQRGMDLLVGVRGKAVAAGSALRPKERHRVRVVARPEGTIVQVDSGPPRTFDKLGMRPEWMRGRLILGNTADGRGAWEGTIYKWSVSGCAGGVEIPPMFKRAHGKVLMPPSLQNTRDININILGFIPFGFVFFLYVSRVWPSKPLRAVAVALTVSAAVSLTIELLQVWLPSRTSSSMDLICNILGAMLGVVVALPFKGKAALAADLHGKDRI
jgi:hypothetical protein